MVPNKLENNKPLNIPLKNEANTSTAISSNKYNTPTKKEDNTDLSSVEQSNYKSKNKTGFANTPIK